MVYHAVAVMSLRTAHNAILANQASGGVGVIGRELGKDTGVPPQPYISRWIRLVLHVLHENSNMLLGLDFQGPVARPSSADLITLCQHFWADSGASISALMSSTYTYPLLDATDRYAIGGAYGSYIPTSPSNGGKSGDPLPANVAQCISLRTGYSGRSYRGRKYMFGWVDADYAGSILGSGAVAALGTLTQRWINYSGPTVCPVSFMVASIKDLALRPINGFTIDNIADSQRRRLPGRGY